MPLLTHPPGEGGPPLRGTEAKRAGGAGLSRRSEMRPPRPPQHRSLTPKARVRSGGDSRGDAHGEAGELSTGGLFSSAGENRPKHFTPFGKIFEPLPCHPAFSYLFACWLFHAELARMTFPAQLPSCFRLFYQPIQLENGYHLAEKQTEKHIFVSKTLMIGRIAPISA